MRIEAYTQVQQIYGAKNHAKTQKTIERYMCLVQPTKEQLKKLNKLRILVRLPESLSFQGVSIPLYEFLPPEASRQSTLPSATQNCFALLIKELVVISADIKIPSE